MPAIVLYLIFGVILFAYAASIRDVDLLHLDHAVSWTLRVLGAFIAVTAAVATLIRSLARETLERQLGYIVPLFAGLLLAGSNWGVALGLAIISAALIVNAILGRSIPPSSGPGAG